MKPQPWILALLLTFPCMADIVELKDGSRLEGDLKRTPEGYEIRAADGTLTRVRTDQVASVRIGKADPKSPAAAQERLASLKRSAESLNDLDQILERFKAFIEQNKGTPVAEEARKEMASWEEKKTAGLVRVGAKWVTPEERERILAGTHDLAEQARAAVRRNQIREAEALIRQVLELDPAHPLALYLQGVVAYRSDKLPFARRSFEQVAAVLPEHAATLNNIGVILMRQNEVIKAMTFFDRAMMAMPENKEILNNVLEAIMFMPENQRQSQTMQKVTRRFAEQDARLSQLMARYGWYRWGSTWVDQAQIERLKEEEKEIRGKMDTMQKEYDGLAARIVEIDRSIDSNERYLQAIRARSSYRDANGNLVRIPYPDEYYDVQRDNERMLRERDQVLQQRNRMREEAKAVEATLPVPKYTGIQQLIGVEGAPSLEQPSQSDAASTNAGPPEAPDPVQPPPEPDTPPTQPSTEPGAPSTQPDEKTTLFP